MSLPLPISGNPWYFLDNRKHLKRNSREINEEHRRKARAEKPFTPEPSPCDKCQHGELCRAKHLACPAAVSFVNGHSRVAWDREPRRPNRFDYLETAPGEKDRILKKLPLRMSTKGVRLRA